MDKHYASFIFYIFFTYAVIDPVIIGLVLELQSIRDDYLRLGIQLGVPHEIAAWEQQSEQYADAVLYEILEFLLGNDDNPMETLYAALLCMDQPLLVKNLQLIYGGSQGNNVECFISINILYTNAKKKINRK